MRDFFSTFFCVDVKNFGIYYIHIYIYIYSEWCIATLWLVHARLFFCLKVLPFWDNWVCVGILAPWSNTHHNDIPFTQIGISHSKRTFNIFEGLGLDSRSPKHVMLSWFWLLPSNTNSFVSTSLPGIPVATGSQKNSGICAIKGSWWFRNPGIYKTL